MKLQRIAAILAALLLCAASAEGMVQIDAASDGDVDLATFFAGAAADRLYLCEASADSIYAISPDGTLARAPSTRALEGSRYLSAFALAADGGRAYAVCAHVRPGEDGNAFEGAGLYALDEGGGIGAQVCEIDLSDAIVSSYEGQEMRACKSALLRGDYLHLLFEEGAGSFDEAQSTQLLLSLQLSTGKKTLNRTTGILQLVEAEGAQLLCARAAEQPGETEMRVIDARTGEERTAHRLRGSADRPRNVVYDRAGNRAFYSELNQIWGIPQIGEEPKRIALLPSRALSGLFCIGSDLLCAYDSKAAYLFPLDWSAPLETRPFTVAGGNWSLAEYARLHPELELRDVDELEPRALIDAVLTQSDVPDLFIMPYDAGVLSALKARGFLLPLEDDAIQSYVKSLHPDLQASLCAGEAPCAVTVSAEFQMMLGVNAALWQRLNLGEVPQSWPALLDFIERWVDSPADGIRLIDERDGAGARSTLFFRMLGDYEGRRARAGDMSYDTEAFRALCARFDGIRWEELEFPEAAAPENTLLQAGYNPTLQMRHAPFVPLPLGIAEGEPGAVTLNPYIAAINPYSKNQDVAVDFLKYTIETMEPIARIELCPGANDPLEVENAAEKRAELEANVAQLEQRAAAEADDARRLELEWELNAAKETLQSFLNDPWAVGPEEIAQYRAASPRMNLMNAAGLDADTESFLWDYQARLSDGEIDVNAFISEVDRRLSMQRLEGAQ